MQKNYKTEVISQDSVILIDECYPVPVTSSALQFSKKRKKKKYKCETPDSILKVN